MVCVFESLSDHAEVPFSLGASVLSSFDCPEACFRARLSIISE